MTLKEAKTAGGIRDLLELDLTKERGKSMELCIAPGMSIKMQSAEPQAKLAAYPLTAAGLADITKKSDGAANVPRDNKNTTRKDA